MTELLANVINGAIRPLLNKQCNHEWIVHFIASARESEHPQKAVEVLLTDISICRKCGSVSYIWEDHD